MEGEKGGASRLHKGRMISSRSQGRNRNEKETREREEEKKKEDTDHVPYSKVFPFCTLDRYQKKKKQQKTKQFDQFFLRRY